MRNWSEIFGVPDPATAAGTSVAPADLNRIIDTAFFSDTDLLFQPSQLIVITEINRIKNISSMGLSSEILKASPVLILVGTEKKKALSQLRQAVGGINEATPAAQQYERYKVLAVDERALDNWVNGAAARCATRLTLAAKALGYSTVVLEVFVPAALRLAISAPEEIDISFVVAVGGPVVQRLGDTGSLPVKNVCFSNEWGQEFVVPKHEVKSELTYRDSLVSYFDILGFRSAVETWEPQRIEEILSELLALSSHDPSLRRVTRRGLSTFSDHVVRTVDLEGLDDKGVLDAIEFEVGQIQHIQANLAVKGIFLRGAIVRGPIHIDEELVFGPALVEAYEKENAIAKYPRVVIAQKLLAHIRSQMMFKGDDGIWSVNYLLAGDDLRERIKLIQVHANVLRSSIGKTSEPRVIEKYGWLQWFHNEIVSSIPEADLAQLKIARNDLIVSS